MRKSRKAFSWRLLCVLSGLTVGLAACGKSGAQWFDWGKPPANPLAEPVYLLTAYSAKSEATERYYGVAVAPDGWLVMRREAPVGAKKVTASHGSGPELSLAQFKSLSPNAPLVLAKFGAGVDTPTYVECASFDVVSMGDELVLLTDPVAPDGILEGKISGLLPTPGQAGGRVIMQVSGGAMDSVIQRGEPVYLKDGRLLGLALGMFRADPRFIEIASVKDLLNGLLGPVRGPKLAAEPSLASASPSPRTTPQVPRQMLPPVSPRPNSGPVISGGSGKGYRQKFLGTWYATDMYLDILYDHTLKLKLGSKNTVVGSWNEISPSKARLQAAGFYPHAIIEVHDDQSVTISIPQGEDEEPIVYKVR